MPFWCSRRGPAGGNGRFAGVFFLIIEQKNDFVRFHAWQSCLVFGVLMVRGAASRPGARSNVRTRP